MAPDRLRVVAALAIVIGNGACSSVPVATEAPTATFVALPAATSDPAASPAPSSSSTPVASQRPNDVCSSIASTITPDFVPRAIDLAVGPVPIHMSLPTNRVVEVADPTKVWQSGEDHGDGSAEVVPFRGGDATVVVELDPAIDDWPVEVLRVAASLRVAGAGRREIPSRVVEAVPDSIMLSLPDKDLRGKLSLEIEASDGCLTYTASGAIEVMIERSVLVDACPHTAEDGVAYWQELADPPVTVGGVDINLFPDEFLFRWTGGAFASQGGDPLHSWAGTWTPSAGFRGGTISVVPPNKELRLVSMSAQFYRRADALEWRASGGREPQPVFSATAIVLGDGTMDLLLPPKAGHYLVSVRIGWASACAQGSAVGPAMVDVE